MRPIRAAHFCAAFNLRIRNHATVSRSQSKRKYLIILNMQANHNRVRAHRNNRPTPGTENRAERRENPITKDGGTVFRFLAR